MSDKNRFDSMASFRDKCRRHNLSITPQRTVIYRELIKSKNHPDSDEIFRKVRNTFPDISLDTVYRTLSKFADVGVANVVEGSGEAKRYDPDINSHHHFRCRRCNRIIDFQNEIYDNLKVPRAFQKNFKVTNIKILLEGTCDKCAKKE